MFENFIANLLKDLYFERDLELHYRKVFLEKQAFFWIRDPLGLDRRQPPGSGLGPHLYLTSLMTAIRLPFRLFFDFRDLTRIMHGAFYCDRRKHGIFGSILAVRIRMYFSTIRPQTARINFALRSRTFRTSTALAKKFRAICGLTSRAQDRSLACPREKGGRILS